MRIQLYVALAIGVLGGALLGGEYFLVKWRPRHQQKVAEEILTQLPYRNEALGIEMQVAAGLYGKVEDFLGGVKIMRPSIWSVAPTVTITTQPNPEHTAAFSPQILAKWQTRGTYEGIPQYNFEHTKIMNRDAVLIWQYKDRAMDLTARVITPERIIEAECTPGGADESLFLQACETSLRTLKVAGPVRPPTPTPGVEEIGSASAGAASRR
jgi:hypothetical protein